MTAAPTRRVSTHAAAAKLIRRDLKAAHPYTTFRVRSRSYAGGSAVDVEWTDGPTAFQVERVVAPYEQCSFDGMQDLKEYTNHRDDIPQVDWVLTQRSRSDEAIADAVAYVNAHYAGFALAIDPATGWLTDASRALPHPSGRGWQSEEIHRVIHTQPLVCDACGERARIGDHYCGECGARLDRDLL